MRVYKESKTGRWYIDYHFAGRRIRYSAGKKKREAEQLQSRITLEINAGSHDPERTKRAVRGKGDGGIRLEELVSIFLQAYKPRSGRADYYEEQSDVWLRFLRGRRVNEINGVDVSCMLNRRLEEVRVSTARKKIVALSTFFRWAKRTGHVSGNPADADNVPRPAEPFNPQVRWLSDEALTCLKDACPVWLGALVAWATETGMDRGQILALRWADLELEREDGRIVSGRFALQRSKTGKPLRQELTDGAMQALNWAARTRHASGIIFLDSLAQPVEEKALEWALSKAYRKAGLGGFNFRTFRHTLATRALRRGIAREVVAKMMGHSTAFITERYMHVADDQLRAAAKAMSGP